MQLKYKSRYKALNTNTVPTVFAIIAIFFAIIKTNK